MDLFFDILFQILPLFGIVFLGYSAVQKIGVELKSLVKLMIYILAPVVFFHGAYTLEPQVEYLILPVFYFVAATAIGFLFLWIGKFFWTDRRMQHLLGYTSGASNVGFMGYPLIIMIFGDEYFALATMIVMGFAIYENTTGLFIAANGSYCVKDSIIKMLKIPTLYAFTLGIILNFFSIEIPTALLNTTEHFKGAYIVIGMMIIGAGLANIKFSSFSIRLITLSMVSRLLVWPALIFFLVWIDQNIFGFYSQKVYIIALFLSLMPLAGSTISFSNEFNLSTQNASIIVFLSLIISVITIPLYWFAITSSPLLLSLS